MTVKKKRGLFLVSGTWEDFTEEMGHEQALKTFGF